MQTLDSEHPSIASSSLTAAKMQSLGKRMPTTGNLKNQISSVKNEASSKVSSQNFDVSALIAPHFSEMKCAWANEGAEDMS
ncbi:hypothetical protein ACK33G_09930 [Aeromonas jandaei]|uniref:hypothetical protein n=1 Tax=Aeromonas jandaei TaxID=650 RepID=UPI0039856B7B